MWVGRWSVGVGEWSVGVGAGGWRWGVSYCVYCFSSCRLASRKGATLDVLELTTKPRYLIVHTRTHTDARARTHTHTHTDSSCRTV